MLKDIKKCNQMSTKAIYSIKKDMEVTEETVNASKNGFRSVR
jgi:hypothetical protein